MSKMLMVPLGTTTAVFERHGFTQIEMMNVIYSLIQVWTQPILDESIQVDLGEVMGMLDMDPLEATMILMEAQHLLNDIVYQVRQVYLNHKLMTWNVLPYCILLEIDDAYETLNPPNTHPGNDGYPKHVGCVPSFINSAWHPQPDRVPPTGCVHPPLARSKPATNG